VLLQASIGLLSRRTFGNFASNAALSLKDCFGAAMPPRANFTLYCKLASHLAMGACLGALFALTLIMSNAANLSDMMTRAADPQGTVALFVGAISSFFAVGATITGFIFIQIEGG
jgi:hypothetical protein